MKYLGIITSSFTLVMIAMLAYLLAFNEVFISKFAETPRKITIGILIIYLLLRLVRLVQQYKILKRK